MSDITTELIQDNSILQDIDEALRAYFCSASDGIGQSGMIE
jgi:hypothetical protein